MQRTYSVTILLNELKMKIVSSFRTKAHLGFNAKRKNTEVTFLSAISYSGAVDRGIYSIIVVLLKKKKKTPSIFKFYSIQTLQPLWTTGHMGICIWLTFVDLASTFTVFYSTPLEESKWLKETLKSAKEHNMINV